MVQCFSMATQSHVSQTTRFMSAALESYEHLSVSFSGCFCLSASIDHSAWFTDRSSWYKPFVLRGYSRCFFNYNYGILKVIIYKVWLRLRSTMWRFGIETVAFLTIRSTRTHLRRTNMWSLRFLPHVCTSQLGRLPQR